MPIKPAPTFKAVPDSLLQIPQPGYGGLNLFDLEYEQEVNQSPYMLNMMYRNGTFSKRYGQKINSTYENKIYAVEWYGNKLLVHSGDKIYCNGELLNDGLPLKKGNFVKFSHKLYYHCGDTIYEYKKDKDNWLWEVMSPYVPEVFINCQPESGGTYDRMDDFNLLTLEYKCVYNGDGTSKNYFPYGNEDDIINWEVNPIIFVNDTEKIINTDFTVDKTNKKIVFTTAPAEGTLNVEITFTMKEENLLADRTHLLGSKYYMPYGSNGFMRLFVGGGGDSKVFYSDSYDATYFPENNWITLGKSEQDVTGFGLQYNILIAFKPNEIYSLYSYMVTSSMVTTDEEDEIGTEDFSSTIVNSAIGCDAPHTIQIINNQLTWFNSHEGVCTLVSTNITDERNVRVLSRNINRTSNLDVVGILDYKEDLDTIVSADFNNKYFISFPKSGTCFMWDYEISPFSFTSSKVTDPKTLSWFLFNNFKSTAYTKADDKLLFLLDDMPNNIIELDEDCYDFGHGIRSYYQTPYYEYGAVEKLKTISNIYVQVRGDKPTNIDMYYLTEENPGGEKEPESISIPASLWKGFDWETFDWLPINIANTFRRKCSIKKVQVLGVRFENNEAGSDMSISHLSFQYKLIKYVK